jgi:hypothetical protein
VAAALVLAAALTLVAFRFRGSVTGSSGGGVGGWSFQYSYQTPVWSLLAFLASAGALACAGTILWLARSPRYVALAAVLALAGAGLLVRTIITAGDGTPISAATYRGIRVGTGESALTARLGTPLSTDASATPPRGGGPIACLLYRAASSPQSGPVTVRGATVITQYATAPAAPRVPALQGERAPVGSTFVNPEVSGLGAFGYLFCFENGRLTAKGTA